MPRYYRKRTTTRTYERRPRFCSFCRQNETPDYKNVLALRRFVTDRGKMVGRAKTGVCAKHQRQLKREIKRARVLALLPFIRYQ